MKLVCKKIAIKALSWRFVATITTAMTSYFITGQWVIAAKIMSADFIIKYLLFFIHEYLWEGHRYDKS